MRRRTTCATFLALAALAAACGRDGRIESSRISPEEAARAAAGEPDLGKLDEVLRGFLAREEVRAAHVTVLRRGEVVFEKGYGSVRDGEGPPTSRSVFPVGSISKQFTAAAVLALVDEGLVRLDAPVRDHLPEWFATDPDLRVSHLLTHTSGLADFLWLDGYRALGDRPETPKAAYLALGASAPRRFPPGERWSYSNTNYKALAVLVERVAGRPFDEVLADRVLRPAGLEGIGPCHDLPPGGFVGGFAPSGQLAPLDASRAAYEGDGGLCATPAALAEWLRKGLAGPDGAPPALRRLATPARLSSGETVPYGYGVSTREFLGHAMIWHAGNVDGHSALLAHAPKHDLGIIVLTNRGFLWLTEVLPPWIGEPPPARAPGGTPPPLGRFEDGLFRYEIAADGDDLRVEIDLIGPLVFVPAGERRWVARDYPASFLLRLPPGGKGDAFEVDWGEVRSFARRTGDAP
ncbi:MAG: beta-lactamase family protein [Thermoanaerobaculia bacterium]|nr:beta-lactamase family protein [Thermoanaerobaculia bacterium]